MSQPDKPATRSRPIPTIDRDINAVRDELLRRRRVPNEMSARDWQSAWDQEPELRAREDALFSERGIAQLERAERETAMARARSARPTRAKACPTCKRRGHLTTKTAA